MVKAVLRALQGTPVDAFSATFEVQGAVADEVRGDGAGNQSTNPARAETGGGNPWKVIRTGIYLSGTQIVTILDIFGIKVSQWARNILTNPDFQS